MVIMSVIFLLALLLGAAEAEQTTTRLKVMAKVVTACNISAPNRLKENSPAALTKAISVRCSRPAVWHVDVDRGKNQPTSNAIRITVHF
jgi:spore coat protein U-like protein